MEGQIVFLEKRFSKYISPGGPMYKIELVNKRNPKIWVKDLNVDFTKRQICVGHTNT